MPLEVFAFWALAQLTVYVEPELEDTLNQVLDDYEALLCQPIEFRMADEKDADITVGYGNPLAKMNLGYVDLKLKWGDTIYDSENGYADEYIEKAHIILNDSLKSSPEMERHEVLAHEFIHALGYKDSSDRNSFMYRYWNDAREFTPDIENALCDYWGGVMLSDTGAECSCNTVGNAPMRGGVWQALMGAL